MTSEKKHTALIDGTEYIFAWPQDRTLLESMIAEAIPAWYSCTDGECGTCQCTLTGGPAHMRQNQVLSRYEVEQEEQTLACQTIRDGEGPYRVSYE